MRASGGAVVVSRIGSCGVWRVSALHDVIASQSHGMLAHDGSMGFCCVTWDASPGAVRGGGSVTTIDRF